MRTLILSPQTLIIMSTALMGLTSIIAWLLLTILRGGGSSSSRGGESSEVYIGGESSSVISSLTEPSESTYWGFVRYVSKALYKYFRDVMHSGRLSDWAEYMSGWYGFLVILTLISIIYYMMLSRGGW